MKITMLGCGASVGVPSLSGGWGACDPAEPKNRRRRCSLLVEKAGRRVLVDASPDLREQLLDAQVDSIDALLFTHMHADHTHGMDDLRPLFWTTRERIPTYADAVTWGDLMARFGYMVEAAPSSPPHFVPPLARHDIDEGVYEIAGMQVEVMRQDHGVSGESLGFIFDGKVAYSTDVAVLSEAQLDRLAGFGLDLWIVDCLREEESGAHASLAQATGWIARVAPKQAYLTHMNGRLDYAKTLAKCPPGVEPGYDGLVVEV
ncbi:MBL fold metallo-hydrolase [Thalassobaculum sp. OXR-137]|uniref:MBL fold metallo-hydrolase n=1 Tax=Thalassobaculum sp. OXR-137 TaxID=3100173 RepID=UPI002AC8BEEA|nr:MBL fold metallo-hydrolase [Thalassobaculum sp. OXR-137]WPZ33151.1 MBL fold metallo-hydrolase [Thalassobaculum sp. OXR-137]